VAKPLIQFLSETSGKCCIWHFLDEYKHLLNKELAARLGVSLRLVVTERQVLKNGGYACRRKEGCKKCSGGTGCA
jgi:hypothetical protein